MNHPTSVVRRLSQALTLVGLLVGTSAWAQLPTAEERLKILTDPESVKAKVEKDKTRPPLELFRSQIAPFDILPFVKANHWSTLSLEMRANYDDYVGMLHTSPVRMLGMPREGELAADAPQEVIYRREVRLLKEQRAKLGLQIMMPRIPKELGLELTRPEAIRADEIWQASLRVLEPFQMLILILSKDETDLYSRWGQFQAMAPLSADREDAQVFDKQRYYRMVLPMESGTFPLSSHPLTWTTLSHIIWDGLPAERLTPAQQQAMLDWLHWGGQLILIGGARPSFAALGDSFLGPYLPASLSGESDLLNESDLKPLSDAFRPIIPYAVREEPVPVPEVDTEAQRRQHAYLDPEPIRPASNRPVYLAGLRPNPGASTLRLGESSERILGVEQRVGRGRILMLALNPTDPALVAWPGLDTLVRRVILRRPEDNVFGWGGWNGRSVEPAKFGPLLGPDLSWFRILSRDLGASLPRPYVKPAADPVDEVTGLNTNPVASPGAEAAAENAANSANSVAEWVDSSALPKMSRDALEDASGISIPSSGFVLKVILAYVLALVPLNWLICRYVFGRREWAWVVVPVLSLGFAIGVERAAAYDMGYDMACDEIDVLETYGDYPRAHLSRFASLYTTGRIRFTISFPNDPTALALPLDNGRSLRGEDITTSNWQSQPVPALEGFQVQPRSLSLFRAEQMVNLPGAITLVTDAEGRRIVNATDLELKDATVVEVNGPNDRKQTYLGTIKPGATIPLVATPVPRIPAIAKGQLNPNPFLQAFQTYAENRLEDQGEIRLVAWTSKVMAGEKFEPAVDRHRGFTAVVVHLENGPPPAPSGPRYDYLARQTAQATSEPVTVPDPDEPMLENGASSISGSRPRLLRGSPPAPVSPAPSRGEVKATPKSNVR
ncbi:hypothetical protein [Singulisphaera acidiphila]|uniref:hypothetical protein n=1 Tax=Singulisphaera acidiphila TaxID=466153 RepID=UPI001ED8FC4F|nr:hypothetical protein [Singulisphaera acidiphila]